jgi:hypothetical protein
LYDVYRKHPPLLNDNNIDDDDEENSLIRHGAILKMNGKEKRRKINI